MERSFVEDLEPTVLRDGSQVIAVDGSVLVVQDDPFTLWRIEATDLGALKSIDDVAPIVTLPGAGQVAATNDGTVAILSEDNHVRWWSPSEGLSEPVDTTLVGRSVDLTIVGSSAALVVESGDIAIVGRRSVETLVRWSDAASDVAPVVVFQQPEHVA